MTTKYDQAYMGDEIEGHHFSAIRDSLNTLVTALVGSESLSKIWWQTPNKAFNNRTPNSLLNREEWIKVKDYLFHHAYCGGGS